MRSLRSITAGALAVVFVTGCNNEKPPQRIEDLRFPVVLLFENAAVRLCQGPSDLTSMHTNYLLLNNQPPMLVDSDFKIYSLENLRSVHNGFWLMANPVAITEVTFELKHQKSGRAEAQLLCAEQLRKQTWRDDQASRLEALNRSDSLVEMEKAISPNDS